MKRLSKALCVILALAICLIPFSAFASENRQLKKGDSGEDVLKMQLRLIELGYTEVESDGIFGEGTEKALIEFQRNNSLTETGIANFVTLWLLYSEDAAEEEDYETGQIFVEDGFVFYESYANTMGTSAVMTEPADWNTREYTTFTENGFRSVITSPLSTFAADVDTASWSQVRQMLLNGSDVPADSVRIEEMLNYFSYDYKQPDEGEPFGVTMEVTDCPWQEGNKLLLIGLQAEEIEHAENIRKNLVFLIDVSGSMDDDNKLPLAKRAFLLLLDELDPEDTISIVTYASSDTVVLSGTKAANKTEIMEAINDLTAGGSTNGSAGILTAYELADQYFIEGGVNRIILATDGDLNVGVTSEGALADLVSTAKESGISLTVLGFGGDNYKDNRLEALADNGDGNYWYIDTIYEARRALVTEAGGTFNTVAKDVKIQVDFNPAVIKGYRLIGYEDRLLNAEDFADDSVDGGEIGSGHRVTALYELVPANSDFDFGAVESIYTNVNPSNSSDWLTVSIRAKKPDSDESTPYSYTLTDADSRHETENIRFAAGIAEFGMLLGDSQWLGTASYDNVLELLRGCSSITGDVYKEEAIYLAGLAQRAD